MKIFMENKHNIAKHNTAFELGHKKFKLAMNKYGDMVSVNSELCKFCLFAHGSGLKIKECNWLSYLTMAKWVLHDILKNQYSILMDWHSAERHLYSGKGGYLIFTLL
jgi:hypothetical protein